MNDSNCVYFSLILILVFYYSIIGFIYTGLFRGGKTKVKGDNILEWKDENDIKQKENGGDERQQMFLILSCLLPFKSVIHKGKGRKFAER